MSDDRLDYEAQYSKGDTPWDSGVASAELVRVLDAGLLPGVTALEIGCGTGTNAIELARRGYRVTAADFVELAVKSARAKARRSRVTIDFRVGDVTEMDLGGPYDVLFDRGVYHHIRTVNLRGFLKMLERVTRRGTRWLSLAGNANEPTKDGPPSCTRTSSAPNWERSSRSSTRGSSGSRRIGAGSARSRGPS